MPAVTKSLALLLALCPLVAAAQVATLVAPADPLPPEQQRQKFHLPPGFEIQLVVAEPDIGQPMNLQFDAGGRLWVTSSVEYPYPADGPGVEARDESFAGSDEPHAPRDTVAVITGIGADGKPQRVTKFAEGLNIPIGVLPLSDGAIVYGIPSVDRHVDTNGDGVADERTALLTGFGNVDTHGMVNGLRQWIDGWVYACHGFRNTSRVKGADGRELTMNSGNTFRFQPDGTRLEQFTWGEVNPFGLTFDPLGNLYNADCHSRPLTLLLRGAYYQSFGKPHDGLGFGPEMIDHSHGSTGICGPAYYAATQFPPDYRDNLFLCNPVTGRVHRDKLVWTGSSPTVDTQPDFITSDDPWFRPVDLTVGPDGALYVADFYNAIIGHYEVPLAHAKRDREKGRIWRVVYVGERGPRASSELRAPRDFDLTKKSPLDLALLLGDDNLTVRVLATHELVHRHGDDERSFLENWLNHAANDLQIAHAMWVLERRNALDDEQLALSTLTGSRLICTHAAKILAERKTLSPRLMDCVLRLLKDDDPFVRRAAADALGRHGDASHLQSLLDALAATDAGDTHLVHTIRIALRDVLSRAEMWNLPLDASNRDRKLLAGVAPAVKTPAGGRLLAVILKADLQAGSDVVPDADWPAAFGHVFQYADKAGFANLIDAVRSRVDDLDRQVSLIEAARSGLQQRGDDPRDVLGAWGQDVALLLLNASSTSIAWSESTATGDKPTWVPQERTCVDGRKETFWCSLPNGEQRTGTLRSQAFELPDGLSFFIAGHAGFPTAPAHQRNAIRLKDAATGATLREAFPPRNDVAQRVEWELADAAGGKGYLELADGDTAGSYAWLAVGRFSVDELNAGGRVNPQRAAELIANLQLTGLAPRLKELLQAPDGDAAVQTAAATALVAIDDDPLLAALVPLLGDPAVPGSLKAEIVAAVLDRQAATIAKPVETAVKTLPSAVQWTFAERLAATVAGAGRLLTLIEQGHASPRLLTRPAVRARMDAHTGTDFASRIETLTADLPAEDEAVQKLIASRTAAFDPSTASAERGTAVFKKHCANCHRIGSEGSLVGPQLDGVGIRGLARLSEDMLDPSRNVDGAFRSSVLVLTSGKVVTGLVRREEGESLVLADTSGKEFRVPKADVEEQVTSPLSLMPANVGETIPENEFRDLLAYLLSQRQPQAK